MPVADSTAWFLFFMFLGAGAMAAVFAVFFVLFILFTPARVWLKSKTSGKPIIAARRRDRKIDYHVAKDYMQGLVTSDKYGSFIVDPDSVYSSKKGGVAVLPVNSEVGITLRPAVLEMIDGLKRMGIDNIEEAEKLNAVWGICSCGHEGQMNPIIENDRLTGLMCPFDEASQIAKQKEEEDVQKKKEGLPEPPKPPEADPTTTADYSYSPEDGPADTGPDNDA